MILHMGGGGGKELAIQVMGGTVQPTGASGMIWCNTNVQANAWRFSVAAPSSPVTGDLWFQTDALSAIMLNVLKRNGVIVNIKRVKQWTGAAWGLIDAWYHDGTGWMQISTTFNPATDVSYTGTMQIVDDGDGHWRIKMLTSGTLTFLVEPDATIDAFLVGGGGGGNYGGGGGGRTTNGTNLTVNTSAYTVVVGAGGAGNTTYYSTPGGNGGQSSAFGLTANGGNGAAASQLYGGDGGSAGGAAISLSQGETGGTNGGSKTGASGQGTTTKAFMESTEVAYGAGGGGGSATGFSAATGGATGGGTGGVREGVQSTAGSANTGGGGGGGNYSRLGSAGGSGIVIIRDHRAA